MRDDVFKAVARAMFAVIDLGKMVQQYQDDDETCEMINDACFAFCRALHEADSRIPSVGYLGEPQ